MDEVKCKFQNGVSTTSMFQQNHIVDCRNFAQVMVLPLNLDSHIQFNFFHFQTAISHSFQIQIG